MKQVLYILPLLSGITLITSCGVSAQKEILLSDETF